jgi:hypothetical protein
MPGRVWDQAFQERWVQGVAAKAKLLQTGALPDNPIPVPPPAPAPDPQSFTRFGMTLERITFHFWISNLDGTVDKLNSTPTEQLSLLWLAWCNQPGLSGERA